MTGSMQPTTETPLFLIDNYDKASGQLQPVRGTIGWDNLTLPAVTISDDQTDFLDQNGAATPCPPPANFEFPVTGKA